MYFYLVESGSDEGAESGFLSYDVKVNGLNFIVVDNLKVIVGSIVCHCCGNFGIRNAWVLLGY